MLTITIQQSNAAFEDSDAETARILRQLADRVSNGVCVDDPVKDINGNTIGKMVTTDD